MHRPAVVLSECKATCPIYGQRQHAPSGLPTPVGDIRKNARNSPFLLAKRYRRVQLSSNATYIILRHQGTYRLGSTLPHSSTQLIKVLNFFSPFIQGTRKGDRQVVFPVGLLVRNGADGRRAGVPSLHSMPAGLLPPHSRDGIISMNRGMDPVWSGLVLGVSPQL